MIGKSLNLDNFEGGMILDQAPNNLKPHQSPYLSNADIRYKTIKKLPGPADAFSSLPSGLTPKVIKEIQFTLPSEKQVMVVYGKNGSDHQLWIRPYVDMSGNWVDDWMELTEREGSSISPHTVDSGSTTTSILVTGLSSTTTDYYKGWIFYDITKDESAIVIASSFSGTQTTLTLSHALSASPVGDSFWMVRNHIRDRDQYDLFRPDDDYVEIVPLENAFIVVTGSKNLFPRKYDLWCGYVDRSYVQDSNLDFKGIWCTRNSLHALYRPGVATAVAASAEEALTAGDYLVEVIAEYDGYQEGPIFGGAVYEDGYQVGKGYLNNVTIATNEKINLELWIPYVISDVDAPNLMQNNVTGSILKHLITDRRLTGLRIYMAKAELSSSASGHYEPIEEWRYVRRVDINATGWAYDAAQKRYETTIEIQQRDYNDATDADLPAGVGLQNRQGHSDLHVYGTAATAAVAAGRVFYGNVLIDEQRSDWMIMSPNNSNGINQPSLMPWISTALDTSPYGMPEIMKMEAILNRLILFGRNRIIRINPGANGFTVAEHYDHRGGISRTGVVSIGDILFFAGTQGILAYLPQASAVLDVSSLTDITDGAIKTKWLEFADANKEACAIGYDRNTNYLVISLADGTFAFHLDRKNWTYYGSTQYIQFCTGVDGDLYGVTSGGAIHRLFADTPTVASQLIYESPVLTGPIAFNGVRIRYRSDVQITVKLYDMSWSETVPKKTRTLPAQSNLKDSRFIPITMGANGLFKFRLETASSTTYDVEIADIELRLEQLDRA